MSSDTPFYHYSDPTNGRVFAMQQSESSRKKGNQGPHKAIQTNRQTAHKHSHIVRMAANSPVCHCIPQALVTGARQYLIGAALWESHQIPFFSTVCISIFSGCCPNSTRESSQHPFCILARLRTSHIFGVTLASPQTVKHTLPLPPGRRLMQQRSDTTASTPNTLAPGCRAGPQAIG